MEILQGFVDAVVGIFNSSGLTALNWQNYVMIGISFILLYLAIKKQYEPLLLLPIAFGMLLVNLCPGIMAPQSTELLTEAQCAARDIATSGHATQVIDGVTYYENPTYGGLLYYLYQGVKLGIYPPLIFLGIGCMTDFGPLISNPKSLILGAAAQIGIFVTFTGAIFLGFTAKEAGAIGIIGGADGPTAIFVTTKLAPHLLGSIAIAAYSYMALVPIIQPPIMKVLTTKKERSVVMEQLRPVSKLEKIMFPVIVVIIISIFLPDAAPLVGMLMLGNLFKESGVVKQLAETASNALMYIVVIILGTSVGATTSAEAFLKADTLKIVVLGLVAFAVGTAGGVLFGKLMCLATKGKVNPLIGSAGVSAVPMAARVSQKVGAEADPTNFLLMHAMGPNVAGVIGTAVVAGTFMAIFGV